MGRGTKQDKSSAAASLNGLSRSVDAFGRTIDRLQEDYAALEERYTKLNAELTAVNEKLQAELEANRLLTVFLDRIVTAVPAGIIAVDPDGIVRLFNSAAATLLDRPVAEVLNRPYLDVWPEREADRATAVACAGGESPTSGFRRELTRADGRRVVLSVATVVIPPAADGQPGGALEVFTDLTVFEALHDEVARMRTLAALGEMAATVAHEIRNPLGGMIGFAELLKRHCAGDGTREEMAGKILAGAQYLNRVVGRMLEFARDPQVSLRPVDWGRFFSLTLDQYEETARRRGATLTLVRRWPEKLPDGRADALCLRQAIWNVLENAEQAAGSGARIEFAVDASRAGGLCLRIADSGPGLDPAIADRVFLPFVTSREKGTGLGLATARKLVEAHGGQISIHNRKDGGAEVCVELPPSLPMPGESG
ncbi:MAG TPA: ATP-binding protein [Acidobacteriota bacterium]|nr:ATP-binding protein [Acidobacteriota bacterium]